MHTGSVAIFDALGFKGIWRRHAPDRVIARLQSLEKAGNEMIDRDVGGSRERLIADPGNAMASCRLSMLSDTVVLALGTKPAEVLTAQGNAPDVARGWAVMVAARFASWIMRNAALAEPAFVYRGCIAHGEFILEENFMVGPAVDQAAEAMNSAQGGFVWLTPSARSEFEAAYILNLRASPLGMYPLVPCDVPLKGGDVYGTYAVSPFDEFGKSSPAERGPLLERIMATFGGGLEVEIKAQNTRRFLTSVLPQMALRDEELFRLWGRHVWEDPKPGKPDASDPHGHRRNPSRGRPDAQGKNASKRRRSRP